MIQKGLHKKYIAFICLLFSAIYSNGQCSPDTDTPTISCPANITVPCPHLIGNIFPFQTSLTPTTSDACGVVLQTYTLTGATNLSSAATGINDASNEIFLAGTTTVSYYIEDAAGNSANCNFTVTVNDYTPPNVTCPSDLTLNNDSGFCYAQVTQTELGFPTASDNCNGITTTLSGITLIDAPNPSPYYYEFPIGTTIVTWTVSDRAGNSETCTQTVTVTDTEDPVITCPSNISVTTSSGQCNAYVNIPTVTASDNCTITSITNDFNSGGANASDTFPIGTTTITFTATDSAGRTAICTVDVTVDNNQPPVITLQGANPQTIETCSTYTELGATANDICLGDVSSDIIVDTSGLDLNTVGTYNVIYTVNGDAATQVIRTINVIDTTSPVLTLTGPNPINVGDCSTYTELGAIATDCSGNLSTSVVIDNASVDTSTVGTYIVTYNVTDASGNVATQITRTVNVIDVSGPDITLNGANPQIIEACDFYTELGATAIDPCFNTDYTANIVIDASAVNTSVVGIYNVTYNVMDADGNSGLEVVRTVEIIDTTGPVITLNAPNPQTIEACDPYTELGAIAIDPCNNTDYTGDMVIDASAVDTSIVGSYNVTYNVMDALGNVALEVVRIVNVVDTTNPTITCPSDIYINNDNGLCSAVVNFTAPTGSDSCTSVTTTQIGGLASGSSFPVGTTTNTFEVTDANGNTSTCSFDVIVSDAEAPKITCPANITTSNDSGLCYAVINYTPPLGTDNCSGQTTVQIAGLPSGSNFPLGTTTNTFQVTDAAGNTATCSFNVTVNDTENPVALCQDITIQLDSSTGLASITSADIDNGSTDNCSVNLSLSQTTFDCSNIGNNTVTLTVTDDAGNSSSCNANVLVTDLAENASVSISASDTQICLGESVTLTATPTDGGTTPSYQWQINGTDVSGEISSTFTTTSLTDADMVTVVMISSLSVCAQPIVSNSITITINSFDTADAGADFINSVCTNTTVTLAGNPVTATGSTGLWTVTSGQSSGYSFSDATSPTSTFTGDIGETYTLTWSIDNPSTCPDSSDNMTVTFIGCNALDFDGFDDNISFKNNYNLSSNFTIEVWLKSETTNGDIQTIISKRESNSQLVGYDLRLVNNYLSFNWNNGNSITSPHPVNSNKWHHIAITFDSSLYTLYIDGINVATANGAAPISNISECLVGAMDQATIPPYKPQYYFDGGMDELRIWNIALTETQIRKMMNQEIENNSNSVRGSITPDNIDSLLWSNLLGYYRMNQISDISGGYLVSNSSTPIVGLLRYMTTFQSETAPIPYKTNANGGWTNSSTWLNGSVQNLPNSIGVDGSTFVDWNIVETSHNVSSGNNNITLLALDVASYTLSIENTNPTDGQSLRVTDYLSIDGTLDLVGESQLLMDTNSIVNYGASGTLQRDQQGTSNLFNYNYWSSPVSQNGLSFSVGNVLNDGSTISNPQSINWIGSYNATGSTNPISLSYSWIYTYENFPNDSYADWVYKGQSSPINVGLGFTLKGSGVGNPVSDFQNYTFIGQPNNGLIELDINPNYQALVGNPYPSAIDANQFITDNGPSGTNSIDGTLYFWEHSTTNASHNLSEYEGGYATYNISGGLAAVTFPDEIGGLGDANKIPQQYIPVAQGFYVTASSSAVSGPGNDIMFNNAQRVFAKESSSNSIFFEANDGSSTRNSQTELISRVRLNVKSTDNSIRPLLLAFTADNAASDNIDYGYDAPNTDNFPNDAAFMIEEHKFVIQGVGAFKESRKYPIGLFLSNSGNIEISLVDLENFESAIDVYIYDSVLKSSTKINTADFNTTLEANDYPDRFYITFEPSESLSITETETDIAIVNYLNDTEELYINIPSAIALKQIQLFNMLGQNVKTWNATNTPSLSNEVHIPIKNISEGIYVVKIETSASKIISKKIIIKYN